MSRRNKYSLGRKVLASSSSNGDEPAAKPFASDASQELTCIIESCVQDPKAVAVSVLEYQMFLVHACRRWRAELAHKASMYR